MSPTLLMQSLGDRDPKTIKGEADGLSVFIPSELNPRWKTAERTEACRNSPTIRPYLH
jgi:hypothetical protein